MSYNPNLAGVLFGVIACFRPGVAIGALKYKKRFKLKKV